MTPGRRSSRRSASALEFEELEVFAARRALDRGLDKVEQPQSGVESISLVMAPA